MNLSHCDNSFDPDGRPSTELPQSFSFPSDCQLHRLTARVFQHQAVLIGGPTAAGKTSFAEHTVEALNHDWQAGLTLLRLDRYFKVKSARPVRNGHCDFDHVDSLHWDWLQADLQDLLAGRAVNLPAYWDNMEAPDGVSQRRSGTIAQLRTGHPLVVESIFALDAKLTSLFANSRCLRVFIDAPERLRLIRRIVREESRGDAQTEQVISEWPAIRQAELESIYPALHTAGMVIQNRDMSGLAEAARFYLKRALRRTSGKTAGEISALLGYLESDAE